MSQDIINLGMLFGGQRVLLKTQHIKGVLERWLEIEMAPSNPLPTHQHGCFKAFVSGQVVLVASGCCPAPGEEASGTGASSKSGPTHGSPEGSEAACYAAVMAACAPTAAAACFESVAGQPACAALRRGASDTPSSTCVPLEAAWLGRC